MPWILKPKEIEALLSSDGKRRYEYFIHRVCETRKLWCLYDDGWAALGDDTHKLLPLWPHRDYAAFFAKNAWDGYTPKPIDLDEFLTDWLPRLEQTGIQPAIFPLATGHSVIVTVTDLEIHLRHELAEYYGEEA